MIHGLYKGYKDSTEIIQGYAAKLGRDTKAFSVCTKDLEGQQGLYWATGHYNSLKELSVQCPRKVKTDPHDS